MAVDSPPGKMRPSTPATSSLTLISLVAAPNLCKTSMCSSTEPCNANTPMRGLPSVAGSSCFSSPGRRPAMRWGAASAMRVASGALTALFALRCEDPTVVDMLQRSFRAAVLVLTVQ